jgi:cytochrome c553
MARGTPEVAVCCSCASFRLAGAAQTAVRCWQYPRMERRRALITRNCCNACHKLDLSSRDNIPHIADQREDYLVKSLREYKNDVRPGYDTTMSEMLTPVTDAQILDLAYYIARIR